MALTSLPTVLRASSALTGSYVASTAAQTALASQAQIYVVYTKGDEASAQIKVEVSPDGTAWFQQTFDSITGGTATESLGEESYSATGNYLLSFPIGDAQIRVQCKATGGTPTGTMKVTVQLSDADA